MDIKMKAICRTIIRQQALEIGETPNAIRFHYFTQTKRDPMGWVNFIKLGDALNCSGESAYQLFKAVCFEDFTGYIIRTSPALQGMNANRILRFNLPFRGDDSVMSRMKALGQSIIPPRAIYQKVFGKIHTDGRSHWYLDITDITADIKGDGWTDVVIYPSDEYTAYQYSK